MGEAGVGSPRRRLEELLDGGTLSQAAADAARDLVRRLDAPARVTLFGLPGAGRARVLNLLAEEPVLPIPAGMPTVLLRHGEKASTLVTRADASRQAYAGAAFAEAKEADVVYVEMTLPAAQLRSMSMMIVVADDDVRDQAAALTWARPRTDIAIWCSRNFDAVEAAIWSCAPESLRDNGFLVMTEATKPMVRSDFVKQFAVDVKAARQDALPDGAARMIEEVRRFAERGRQAIHDQALLFLSRYGTRRTLSRQRRIDEAAIVAAAAARLQVEGKVAEAAPRLIDPLAMLKTAMAATAVPVPAMRTEPRQVTRTIDPGPHDVPRVAADFLRRRAQELSREMPTLGTDRAPRVLNFCQETMDELVERVTAGDLNETVGTDVEDLLLDAADVILLLQSEEGDGPAADAVALLLQLRRDLEMRIAA